MWAAVERVLSAAMRPFPVALPLAVALALLAAAQDVHSISLDPLPEREWDRAAAAHLLRRAGFGGSPAEIDRFAAMTLEQAVASLVDYEQITYECAPPALDDRVRTAPDRPALRDLSELERRRAQQERRQAERRSFEEVRLWWLERMANSPRPLEEKLTLFWHGHFTSGMREVRRAAFMLEQNELLRRYALGNFHDLVLGVSRDRAMLVYLDGYRNVRRNPNENYARELLELYTLGTGNYSEGDVRAAARAFTGWTFDDDGFRFIPRNHDTGEKQFLGRRGNWDGYDIVEIVLEQPACSRFLSRKLLQFFVRPDPDRRLVERLALVIRRNNYELKPALRTLFQSRAFYHPDARGALVKSPVELLVGTARQLDIPLVNLAAGERALAAMGQELMQPPNVKGWDGGPRWINAATLYNRYNTIGVLLAGDGRSRNREQRTAAGTNDENPQEQSADSGAGSTMMSSRPAPVSRRTRRTQFEFDPLPELRARELRTPEQIVDFHIQNLLATTPADAKRQALIEYLADDGKFDLRSKDAAERVRTMVDLLCSTPEYQVN